MSKRHVFEVELAPVAGSTFQPTGFPDLGAATFSRPRPDGSTQECVLVESVQSMANRLEATGWDSGANGQVAAWAGLPYLEVRDKPSGDFLTSSRLEAHRIFSAFVRDADWGGTKGDLVLLSRLGLKADTPLNYREMAKQIAAIDPLSLVHGVFFAGKSSADKGRGAWPANPKFTRAVTATIEAHDVKPVASGGRKADLVRHSVKDTDAGTGEGYGSVPFHRVEYTAASIKAFFVVDLALIGSYGLPAPVTKVLETLALWEVRSLLDDGLRLRAACDLEPVDAEITDRRGAPLASLEDLTATLRENIDASTAYLGEGGPVVLTWQTGGKK